MASDQSPKGSQNELQDESNDNEPSTSGSRQGAARDGQKPCDSIILNEGNVLKQIRVSVNDDEEEDEAMASNIEIIRDCLDIDGLKQAHLKIKKKKKATHNDNDNESSSTSTDSVSQKFFEITKETSARRGRSLVSLRKENLTSKSVSFATLKNHKSSESLDSEDKPDED